MAGALAVLLAAAAVAPAEALRCVEVVAGDFCGDSASKRCSSFDEVYLRDRTRTNLDMLNEARRGIHDQEQCREVCPRSDCKFRETNREEYCGIGLRCETDQDCPADDALPCYKTCLDCHDETFCDQEVRQGMLAAKDVRYPLCSGASMPAAPLWAAVALALLVALATAGWL